MDTDLTIFLKGKLRVHQPARGNRFTIDSVLIAGFARALEGEPVLDLGTGCGIILLLLKALGHPGNLTGVEIRPDMALLAVQNLQENGYDEGSTVVEGDLRREGLVPPGPYGLVVSNPPFFKSGAGLESPHPGRAAGRHDATCTLEELARAAGRVLAPRGRFCFIAPASRLGEAVGALDAAGLGAALFRRVRDRADSPAHRVMVQARRGPTSPLDLTDLVLREAPGRYSREVRLLLGEEVPPAPRFLCDGMLGTLARTLRLLGVDAAFARGAEDSWLLEEASRSGRVLLTRDGDLVRRTRRGGVPAFNPDSDAPREQLALLRRAFPSMPAGPARCTACNVQPLAIDRSQALGRVPPYTYLTRERFQACPRCGKLTWEGSHLERFRQSVGG